MLQGRRMEKARLGNDYAYSVLGNFWTEDRISCVSNRSFNTSVSILDTLNDFSPQ